MIKNCLLLLALFALPAAARATILVDGFGTAQNLAIAPGTSSDSGGVVTPGAIGGARWASLGTDGGANPTGSSTVTVDDGGNGILAFTPNENDHVRTTLIYDADAVGAHVSISGNGLGSINLQTPGELTFQLSARSTHEVEGFLFLYTATGTNWNLYTFTFPGLGVDVPFSAINIDLTMRDGFGGSGFNPLSLGAIALSIDNGVTSGLVQIDHLSFVPEPSSALLLAIGLFGLTLVRHFRRRRR